MNIESFKEIERTQSESRTTGKAEYVEVDGLPNRIEVVLDNLRLGDDYGLHQEGLQSTIPIFKMT